MYSVISLSYKVLFRNEGFEVERGFVIFLFMCVFLVREEVMIFIVVRV